MPPKETLTPDEKYQKTIDGQRAHLLALQKDFNGKCDQIKDKAKARMKQVPQAEREAKERVLLEQKKELEEALAWLKGEVNGSTRKTMRQLEEIQREREKTVLSDLEKQIAAL